LSHPGGQRVKFWSRENSIFTKVAAVLLLAYVASLIPIEVYILTDFGYVIWERVGVICLALGSVILQFVGRRNLGFLVAMIAVTANFLWSFLNDVITIFTYDWRVLSGYYGEITYLEPLYLASLILLPLASILLIIGRPEWKLLKVKA
jgi:hypothetical protein